MDIRGELELSAPRKSTTISRVAPQQRKLHPEQFKYEHISLGLYDRWDSDTMPKSKGDTFRLAIVKAVLTDLSKGTSDWDDICKQIVESPQKEWGLYDEECLGLPADEVRSVLTLDAMFLASYLGGLFLPNVFSAMFPSAYETLTSESTNTRNVLMEDIIMLENQIPLPLIRRAFTLALEWRIRSIDSGSPRTEHTPHVREAGGVSEERQPLKPESNAQGAKDTHKVIIGPDELFQKLCLEIVAFYYNHMPGCKLPDSRVKIDYQFDDAKHLLDCLYCAMCRGITPERPMGDETRLPLCLCGSNAKDVNETDIESHGLSDEFTSTLPEATELHEATIETRRGQLIPEAARGQEIPLPEATIETRRGQLIPEAARGQEIPLPEAGSKSPTQPGGFRDVEFKVQWFKAILYLPVILYLGDPCEQLWRNLVAWEDYKDENKDEFKAYLELMDDLISTEKDVAMMTRGKHPVIVINGLGSEEVVKDLFNSMLDKCVVNTPPEWRLRRQKIYKYYSNEARRDFVEYRRTYCGKWWLTLSFVAGGILLVLTLLEFVYTMLSYYHQ